MDGDAQKDRLEKNKGEKEKTREKDGNHKGYADY